MARTVSLTKARPAAWGMHVNRSAPSSVYARLVIACTAGLARRGVAQSAPWYRARASVSRSWLGSMKLQA